MRTDMNPAGMDPWRLSTATKYIAAAEAELAANSSDRQLGELVKAMREVISTSCNRYMAYVTHTRPRTSCMPRPNPY